MKRKDYLNKIGKVIDSNIRYTNATKFLLPMIGLRSGSFDTLVNVHIIPGVKPQLVVILENNDTFIYKDLAKCKVNKNYIEDYNDEDEIIIKFNIPNIDTYSKFLDGRYSQFDNSYKELLLGDNRKVFDDETMKVTLCDTLYPRKQKIRAIANILGVPNDMIKEVYDRPDLSYEVYTPITQLTKKTQEVHG